MTHPPDAMRLVPSNDDAPTNRKLARALSNHSEVMVVERSDPSLELTERSLEDVLDELAEAPASPLPEGGGWQDIITAPDSDHSTFVVQAFEVRTVGGVIYTSDPVCVWRNLDGSFARWKQDFAPTHWMPLPAAPTGDAHNGKGEEPHTPRNAPRGLSDEC